MENISSFDLLNLHLVNCAKASNLVLEKAKNGEATKEETTIIKEISHLANILTAIYFYRKEKDLAKVIKEIPIKQKKVLEESITTIWNHLIKLNDVEISEVCIDAIRRSSNLFEKIC